MANVESYSRDMIVPKSSGVVPAIFVGNLNSVTPSAAHTLIEAELPVVAEGKNSAAATPAMVVETIAVAPVEQRIRRCAEVEVASKLTTCPTRMFEVEAAVDAPWKVAILGAPDRVRYGLIPVLLDKEI